MARTDKIVLALAAQLSALFTDASNPPRGGTTGPPQLRAGDGIPALDGFDDCTLLWVNVTRRYRTTSFPEPSVNTMRCGAALAVEVQVGVARCSQALTSTGGLPSAETMAAEFATQEDDADRLDVALCRAAKHALDDMTIHDWLPVGADVVGPEGGTVAAVAQAVFHLAH